MSLELDFEVLCDDFDRLVALESIGVRPDNVAVRAIAKRWCVGQFAAGESRDKTVKTTSNDIAQQFNDFFGIFGNLHIRMMKKMQNQCDRLEKHADDLEARLAKAGTLQSHEVKTGSWTSMVCLEDVPNFKACLALARKADALEAVVKQYTVATRQNPIVMGRYKETDDGFEKLGYSTNAAIHRASGILGRFTEANVKARPLAGNVIIVTRGEGEKERVEFGVAMGGNYKDKIPALETKECKEAIAAIRSIAKTLRNRGAENSLFGYHGIYKEIEKMKADLKKYEGKELKAATWRYKNALQLENGFTVALDRVGDGLVNWVAASIKAG